MRSILARLLSLVRRYRLVASPRRGLSRRSLVPLAAMLPVVIYAYAVQAVVTSRTELHQHNLALLDLQTLKQRLDRALNIDAANCLDYAHWDDSYQQVVSKDPTWIKLNLRVGLDAFGFDVVVFQSASGEIVYAKGANDAVLRDIARYGILKRCMNHREGPGMVVLDGRVYTCASNSILRSDGGGQPRGMLFLGRLATAASLAELGPGTQHKLSLCQPNGQVIGVANLGPLSKMPESVGGVVSRSIVPSKPTADNSTDRMTSYGCLPIYDIVGQPAGVLIDVRSRASTMATLRAIRHMSISLMILCGVIGVAGVSYFRNRALALRANRDELTGLYNHGYVQDYLKNQVLLAERYGRPLALMMVDIDHFKFVNDIHGHATGDTVLRAVAATILQTVRATDVAARYGGEEFVVVLPETDLLQAIAGAERLRSAIQSRIVAAREAGEGSQAGSEVAFTVSIGVASHPDDGVAATDLLQAADAALTEAKRTRNVVYAYRDILKGGESARKRIAVLDGFLRDSSLSTVGPLVTAIDTRDPGSVRHSEKTAEYAVAIGRELGLSTQDLAMTCKAALLHDVGMIGVPDNLLTKTSSLSDEEMAIVRRHCRLGADILSQSPHLAAVAEIVLRHHERWNGTGYPGALAGDEIPIIARVVAVADSLDAMTSSRSYKEPMSFDDALQELQAQSGKQFDPDVIEAAARVIQSLIEQQEDEKAAA